ncbi:Monoamine oxidase [Legionella steigerwaltii]|uniref:Tryptophan 2-monooxygenase n=1 Tax=Legionella steigerwaltii TaxID=460 RepID=A0A378L9E3_9GAMM|nr:NAD(P)/FAD-dependent oxidoreductase [Legionella steigerwaltii]KTD80672.1 amine oxidase [Legionella steigerwaltii]STY22488.1 Monoamine oxidase [Legionella steigerwaltii]
MLIRIFLFILSLWGIGAHATKTPPTQYKVIIIGSGIAGLEAAHYLQKHGVDNFIILEARDRIGGRANTVSPWPNCVLELGASMIHGDDPSNPLMKLVQKWNLATMPVYNKSAAFYDVNGKEISDSLDTSFQKLYAEFEKLVMKKQDDPEQNANTSISDVVIEFINSHHLNKEMQHGFLYEVSDKIEQEYAADIRALSVVWYDNEKAFPGRNLLLTHGYQDIINGIAKEVSPHILLKQIVTKIDYQNKEHIVVTTADSKQFTGEYVICTLPLGVLKSGSVTFVPQLPQDKILAMNHLNMGIMNKVFMLFPKVFWDTEQYISVVSPAYWSGKKWIDKGVWIEFDNLNAFFHQPILAAIVSGDFARDLENKSDAEIIQSVMKRLRDVYGDNIPEPTAHVITRWGKDPFSVGAYSSIRPGSLEDGNDYLNLAKTVEGHLLFAGEATTNIYPSTVYGAYLSGDRAAQELLNHLSAK